MAAPPEVLETLQTFAISGLPSVAQSGEQLTPTLDRSTSIISDLSVARVLASLDLTVLFNQTLDPNKQPVPGPIDLFGLMKAAKFAAPIEADATALNAAGVPTSALPFLEPTINTGGIPPYSLAISPDVEGLIAKLRTTLKANVAGTIFRKVLAQPPVITVTWTVEDEQQNAIAAGMPTYDYVDLGTATAPAYVFLPRFVEFTTSVPARRRLISCDITVDTIGTAAGGANDRVVHRVGPVAVDILDVPIPTVMAMTENGGFGGRVLLTVPGGSAVAAASQLSSRLQPALEVLGRLQALGLDAVTAVAYPATAAAIRELLGLSVTTFRSGDQDDLDDVVRQVRDYWPDKTWEDCIDSILLIGPTGRRATVSDRKHQWSGAGKFQLSLGRTCFSRIAFLINYQGAAPHYSPPNFTPADSTFTEITAPEDGNYHDNISSFAFL